MNSPSDDLQNNSHCSLKGAQNIFGYLFIVELGGITVRQMLMFFGSTYFRGRP